MLNPEKIPAALFAIHFILVKARNLALAESAHPQQMAKILDWAEVLPSLITRQEEDTTQDFRQILAGLGEEFPEFAGILPNFDNNHHWDSAPRPNEPVVKPA